MKYAECHPDKKHQAKGLCKSCYNKHLLDSNPEYKLKQKQNSAEWVKKNKPNYWRDPEKKFNGHLRRTYGLSREDYEQMLDQQNGVCAICSRLPTTGKKLHVDHNHATGKVRGLLCFSCNWFVGLVDKGPTVVERIKEFI